MLKSANAVPDDKGLSARHLVLLFLVGVAVCGVFFSLGFLVGYNERSSQGTPVTERVSTPAPVPPNVNAPLETTQIGSNGGGSTVPPPVAQAQPQPSAPVSPPEGETPAAAPAPAAAPVKTPRAVPASASPVAAPKASAPAASSEVGVGFTVQVTASRTKQDAEALVKILSGRGYPVFLVTPEYAHASDHLYRVQVGPFKSKEDAEKVRTKLTHEGFKPFIKK